MFVDVLRAYFLNFRYFFIAKKQHLVLYSIERLKTIKPGAGHLPGSFIPTPGNLQIFFKEMLMPRG